MRWIPLLVVGLALPGMAQPLRLTLEPPTQACKLNSQPFWELRAHNTTKGPIHFRYFLPTFWYPTWEGHFPSVVGPVYDGPAQPVQVDLPAGQNCVLPIPAFTLVADRLGDNRAYWVCKPGKYRCRFEIQIEDWKLVSNWAQLEVKP